MKALRRKLKSRRGFTMAELLMVILILALVGSVVVSGIPAAMNAYRKVVDGANAQLLLSTTVSSLRRELSLAKEVKTTGEGKLVSYTNGETGYEITLIHSPDEEEKYEGIALAWHTDFKGDQVQLLVTKAAATKNMISEYDSITYENGVFAVKGLQVKKDGKILAALDSTTKPLYIRSVMNAEATT